MILLVGIGLGVGLWNEQNKLAQDQLTITNTASKAWQIQTRTFMNRSILLEDAMGIPITQAIISSNSVRRTNWIRPIMFITIHETANTAPSADAAHHSILLNQDETDYAGWHYTVDDHSIYHSIPDNEVAYNAGDNFANPGGNRNGIGIEMCVNEGADFEITLDNTERLVATLLYTYDLQPEDIRLHRDWSGKICPNSLILEGRVEEFMAQCTKYLYEIRRENHSAIDSTAVFAYNNRGVKTK